MNAAVLIGELKRTSPAERALKAAASFWFVMALIGQWAFFYYIVAFYGASTVAGDLHHWTRRAHVLTYVAGDSAGNLFFAAHVLLAAVVTFGGTLQLISQMRRRVNAFHRWNGRLFMVTALAVSLAGLYLVWVRRSNPGVISAISISLNAVLIIIFVALAWRAARSRDFATHRRWALRLYMVSNGQWFFRVGIFALIVLAPKWVEPVFLAWGFGCYLVPLLLLEVYLRGYYAGARVRVAIAACLLVLTAVMAVGVYGVYTKAWHPMLTLTGQCRSSEMTCASPG